jgi:hypothetical protein
MRRLHVFPCLLDEQSPAGRVRIRTAAIFELRSESFRIHCQVLRKVISDATVWFGAAQQS